MKRSLLVLAMAGALALMLTPEAFAQCTGLSGNYAVLMQGGMPITGDATGVITPFVNAPNPAPVGAIGAIQLDATGCTITGELIVSSGGGIPSTLGDNATWCAGPGLSTYGGPLACCTGSGEGTCPFVSSPWGSSYDPNDYVPGFNGSNTTLSGTYTFLGKNGGNQGTMTFTDANSGLTFHFNFVLATSTGEILGTSTSTSETGADPVLSLRGETQPAVSLTQSLGNHALSCTGQGEFDVTSVAVGPEVLGGTLDVLAINPSCDPATGNCVTSAGGVVTLNLNEDWQNLTWNTSEPGTSILCAILEGDQIFTCPALYPYAPPTENCPHLDTFATGPWTTDGTADINSSIGQTPECPLAALPLNLQTSQVPWGKNNENSFAISTGLDSFSAAPGTVSTCLASATSAGTFTIKPTALSMSEGKKAKTPSCKTVTAENYTGAAIPMGLVGASIPWWNYNTLTASDTSITMVDNCGSGQQDWFLYYEDPDTSPPTTCSSPNEADLTDCGYASGSKVACTTSPSDPMGVASCWDSPASGGVCSGGYCINICNDKSECTSNPPYAFSPITLMPGQDCTVSVCCGNTGTPATATGTLTLGNLLAAHTGNAVSYYASNDPSDTVSVSCAHN